MPGTGKKKKMGDDRLSENIIWQHVLQGFGFRYPMKNLKRALFSFLIVIGVLDTAAYADERWYVDATVNGMAGRYSDAELRDNFYSGSAWLNVDYIDIYSFAVAYNNLNISFKDAGSSAFDVNQQAFAGRFQYYFYNDTLGGKITAQLVAHDISNDARPTQAGDVTIISPKLVYTNYAKDLSMDLEYVWSSYSDNGDLIIQQFAPSIGFGFNKNFDWLQFKAYLIKSDNKLLSQGEDSLASVDIKWTHWFSPGAILGMDNFFIDVLAGERVFAVENASFTVYNLEAVQQGSVQLGFGWRIGESFDVTAIAGVEQYKNKVIDNAYDREYLYISMTKHW